MNPSYLFEIGCILLMLCCVLFSRWYGRWYDPRKRSAAKHGAVCLAFLLFLYTATIGLLVWYVTQVVVILPEESSHAPAAAQSGPDDRRASGGAP